MKKIIIIIILILISAGCSSNKTNLKELMQEEHVIVDVRTKEEYEISHVKNAINIPYDEIDNMIQIDKDKIVLVYCASGNRSKIAYTKLTNLGYKTYDLGSFKQLDLPKE